MSKHLTIVIPTFNGIVRLVRLCEWVKKQNFGGELIVVSSDAVDYSSYFSDFAFVRFLHCHKTNVLEAMVIGFQNVNTRYCCYLGDDDLPTLSSYQKCCDFLDDHPEYGSARGAMGFVDYVAFLKFNKLDLVQKISFKLRYFLADRYDGYSDLSSYCQETRIAMINKHYIVSQFFVTRTQIAKTLYSNCWSKIDDNYLAEKVWCFLHAATTRSAFISSHFLMRGLGAYRGAPVEDDCNLTSESRILVKKKYVHGLIKKIKFDQSTRRQLLSSIFEQNQKKSIKPSGRVGRKIFWFKRLPRRLHFIVRYQFNAPMSLFRSELEPGVHIEK